MTIAFVQSATQVDVSASSTTAPSITLAGTTGGNALVGVASIYDGNNTWTLSSTTDGGNTFTSREGPATYSATDMSRGIVAHAVNITGGSRTVAFNMAGTSGGSNRYYTLGLMEFSGVATSSAEDTWDVNSEIDTSGTDVSGGPITTTDAGDLLVGVASITGLDTAITFGSPASWTNKYRQNNSANPTGMDAGYWLPGSIQTTYTAQWSHDNSAGEKGAGVVVALKAAGGGPVLMSQILL